MAGVFLASCTGDVTKSTPLVIETAQAGEKLSSLDTVSNTEEALQRSVELPSSSEFPEFTTKGKPTKTVETPWGSKEVYDIKKDPDIKHALEIVYKRNDVTFGDISYYWNQFGPVPANMNSDVEYLRQARLVSQLDFYRLSCQRVELVPCHYWGEFNLGKSPVLENLGSPTLSEAEKDLQVFSEHNGHIINYGQAYITEEMKDKGRWEFKNYDYKPPLSGEVVNQKWKSLNNTQAQTDTQTVVFGSYLPVASLGMCGFDNQDHKVVPHHYIGKVSGFSPEKTLELITEFSCSKWFELK